MTKVAAPVGTGSSTRAIAAGAPTSRRMETNTSVRRMTLTPARTRTRLAKGLTSSIFSLPNPDFIVCSVRGRGNEPSSQHPMPVLTDILPPRYRGPHRIARGGMGDIYRATDSTLGRDVAIKLLADRYAADASVRERFTREALAAARFS